MASLFLNLLSFLLLQLLLFTSAQPYQNVTLGSSLSTIDNNPSWISPSGEFAFGFHATQGENLFLLAIWFAKVPTENIVWTANEGWPVQRGSTVQLTRDGVLSLTSPNGTVLWKPDLLSGTEVVASAAMLDTGNFVILSSDSTIIWASFQNPTNTLLPSQVLDRGGILISPVGQGNYTPGRFQLTLQADGNLVLYPLARPTENRYRAYWDSKTEGNGSQLSFNLSGYLYLTLVDGGKFTVTTGVVLSTTDFYHRATFDFDGVFRQYTYPKSSSSNTSWSFAWSIPENICTQDFWDVGSGICGFNSYCKLQDKRPTCGCPPGYNFSDPNNEFGGCKQNFIPQSCQNEKLRVAIGYEMRQLPGTDWPRGDYECFNSQTENWCGQICLNDCLCAAAVIRDRTCCLKRFPLSNGRSDSGLEGIGKALIKVGNSSPVYGGNKKEHDKLLKPGSILLGTSAFLYLLLLLILLFIYFWYGKKQYKTNPDTNPDTTLFGMNLRSFTYKELEEATDGFKEELGQGSFSTVYKGRLKSVTESLVAVKRLDRIAGGIEKEFKTEMSAIGWTNHKNLVKLLGFCEVGNNRLLVYEYMKNGSLADLLFGSSRPDWSLRIQIAFGIARGLAYLHEDCSTQIIHCDVKPQNILLDDSFMAKISDFGLAKLLKSDQSRTNTYIRGTKGYAAPEWFKSMAITAKVEITAKVDVYSFGVVLLEIICCRRNFEIVVETDDMIILSNWAYECCVERKFHLLVEDDEEAKKDKRLSRLVMVAIWCIQDDPYLRPSMKKVTQMLEGAVDVSMPPEPSLSMS